MLKQFLKSKVKAQIEVVCPMMILLVMLVIIGYEMQISQLEATKTYTEDALAMSLLASAVIDIEEYGMYHTLAISDAEAAFGIYKRALRTNMGLGGDWCSPNTLAISGEVKIEEYIIYNVRGTDVEIISMGQTPGRNVAVGGLGTVAAPNGQIIASTSVYSRITFPVDGIWGFHMDAVKDKLVDIVGGS